MSVYITARYSLICDDCGFESFTVDRYARLIEKTAEDGWIRKQIRPNKYGTDYHDICPKCVVRLNYERIPVGGEVSSS